MCFSLHYPSHVNLSLGFESSCEMFLLIVISISYEGPFLDYAIFLLVPFLQVSFLFSFLMNLPGWSIIGIWGHWLSRAGNHLQFHHLIVTHLSVITCTGHIVHTKNWSLFQQAVILPSVQWSFFSVEWRQKWLLGSIYLLHDKLSLCATEERENKGCIRGHIQ